MPSPTPQHPKIVSAEQFVAIRERLFVEQRSLVQCHGCFDIVHPGHIRHLRHAAAQGEKLLVSITADEFVNKGPGRPMFGHDLRAENMAALEFVDWVIVHHAETATDLLRRVRPDVYIKGAEYATNNDPRFAQERAAVEAGGGRVMFSSGDVVFSSTSIVRTINAQSTPRLDATRLAQLAQQHDLSSSMIRGAFTSAAGKRVVVVGETIRDIYQHCQNPELAREHPMLSLRPAETTSYDGGGAIIALHLAAMGLKPILVTPLADDAPSRAFVGRMSESGVEVEPVVTDSPIAEKTRYIVGRDKVMKIDASVRHELSPEARGRAIDAVRSRRDIACMVIADFGLGMFAEGLAAELIDAAREQATLILGDVSGQHADLLNQGGADLLCPCESELRYAMGEPDAPLQVVAMKLIERSSVKALAVTLGREGVVVFTQDRGVFELPAMSRDPIDVLGCGDALLSGMGAAVLGGANLAQAAYIGSLAAALEGVRLGNHAVGASQIVEHAAALSARYELARAGVEPKPDGAPSSLGQLG